MKPAPKRLTVQELSDPQGEDLGSKREEEFLLGDLPEVSEFQRVGRPSQQEFCKESAQPLKAFGIKHKGIPVGPTGSTGRMVSCMARLRNQRREQPEGW